MERNFEAQLGEKEARDRYVDKEAVEARRHEVQPILDELIERYLDVRQQKGPDGSWERKIIDGEQTIVFRLFTGYEEIYYVSEDGRLFWHVYSPDPLMEFTSRSGHEWQSVVDSLIRGGNWDSDEARLQKERIAEKK